MVLGYAVCLSDWVSFSWGILKTSSQNILPNAIRLMIGARFGYVQCGPINTDSNGVRVLEFTPMSNNCLGAGIDGEATHW